MELKIFLIFLGNVLLTHAAKLPDYIHLCHRSDPNINECVRNSIEFLRPNLIEGMPELKVPSIEPLIIEELIATEGSGLKVTTRNLKAYGGSNFTLVDLNIDPVKRDFGFTVSFKHLHINGMYDVDGKIIMIPIKGKGEMQADVYDVVAKMKLYSELTTKDDGEYIQFTNMDMDFSVGKGTIKLENLFGGDKLIGDVINSAINLNFQYFLKELNPTIVQSLTQFIMSSANNIVQLVPYSDAFPE